MVGSKRVNAISTDLGSTRFGGATALDNVGRVFLSSHPGPYRRSLARELEVASETRLTILHYNLVACLNEHRVDLPEPSLAT